MKVRLGELIFSKGTYQVEVFDLELRSSFWPFLKLDDQGELIDFFCTCPLSEKEKWCPHLEAAFIKVRDKEPLHIQFEKSFWNRLLRVAAGRDCKIRKRRNCLFCKSDDGYLFSLSALTVESEERLKELLVEQKEKMSLKFSILSEQELKEFREGKVSFELSLWSDIAKLLFLMQKNDKSYDISFWEDGYPRKVTATFEDLKLELDLKEEDLLSIIPSLNSIKTPLELFKHKDEEIETITYDPITVTLYLKKKKDVFSPKKGKKIGPYLYVSELGFFPLFAAPFLKKDKIAKEEISEFLSLHYDLVENTLQGVTIEGSPISAKYFLFFDKGQNLHIRCFVFEKEDLFKKYSYFFDPWVYLEGQGFFLLKDLFFGKEKIVPKGEVADFVNQNKVWLNNFKGFQINFGPLPASLKYNFTKKGLVFFSELDMPKEFKYFDFGRWVYLKDQGFYVKKIAADLKLPSGFTVKRENISKFILDHREELKQVEGFFMKKSPVQKRGLNIFLNEKKLITVRPEVVLKEGYKVSDVVFLDHFLYSYGEGFFEVLEEIPQEYRKESVVSSYKEPFFIMYEIEKLRPYIVSIDRRLQKVEEFNFEIKSLFREKNAYFLSFFLRSKVGEISAMEVYKGFLEGKKYLFSEAGLIFLKDTRFDFLLELDRNSVLQDRNLFKLSTIQLFRYLIIEGIKEPKGDDEDSKLVREEIQQLKSFKTAQPYNLEFLKSTLRPYQKNGFQWLWFMYLNGLSAFLCDEMGLGKTHQAMALIAALLSRDENLKCLVVCPTSVIYHWENLLNNFLKDIKVLRYHGPFRSLRGFSDCNLLLTTYGMVRVDENKLKDLNFEVAIFDEVQTAKNYSTKIYTSLKNMNANSRFGLTGTPIENSLRELKTLFDLVIPGYFPRRLNFLKSFIIPIEREKDKEKEALLAKLIKPFMLRRRKKEVLSDLPEKTEEIVCCDLSEEQRKMYDDALFLRREVIEELKDRTKPINYIHIFSLLSRLKQICNHPSLIFKDLNSYFLHESGKWNLFVELLDEALASSQKVVVFSQYLDMITIFSSYLKKKGIKYAVITGATVERYKEIERFQKNPDCLVFLGSLLASGIGIDLSAASVVIHYDRWWNPAKENQATDRVHRIGQTRGVLVIKLVAKDTLEENIHSKIQQKTLLAEQVLGFEDTDQIKYLTREELIELLRIS